MELWDNNRIKSIQELLDYLLSAWQDNGGYSFSAKTNIAFNEFLCSSQNEELNRRSANETLTKMKKSSKRSLDEFENIYNEIHNEHKKKQPVLRKWNFFMPVDAEFEDDIILPTSMTLLGCQFRFTNKILHSKKILKQIPFELLDYEGDIKNHIHNKRKVFLNVSSTGENMYSAWENIRLPFNVFRGIIEFSFSFRGFQWSSESKPRSILPHPKWVLVLNDKALYEGSTFNVEKYNPISKFKFSQKHFKIIKNNSRIIRVNPPKNSSKQILIN